jgi:hypothetical protein
VRLFRDGAEVFRGVPKPVEAAPGTSELAAAGVLQLGKEIPSGSHVLELAVTDRLAKNPIRTTQVIDFEVID